MGKTVKDLVPIDQKKPDDTNVNNIRYNIAQILVYIKCTRSTKFCLAGSLKANDLKCRSLLLNYKAWLAYKQATADDLMPKISLALDFLQAS